MWDLLARNNKDCNGNFEEGHFYKDQIHEHYKIYRQFYSVQKQEVTFCSIAISSEVDLNISKV